MPKFKIDLVAYAHMSQNGIEIEAETIEEAEEIAIETAGDRDWEYEGVNYDTIDAYESRS